MTGLAGRASSTRGTYRSALYRLAEAVHGEPGRRATPFAGAEGAGAVLAGRTRRSWPRSRPPSAIRRDGPRRWPMAVFGIGAGLRPGELVALRGSDVTRHGRQVRVQVSGPAARVVPVTAAYAGRAAGLAAGAGHAHLFRPGPADRGYKNFVTNFARTLAADPAAPRLALGRCRSSFICDHLAAGTPLRELLAITGICQAESLARYARHVDGAPAKAALRAWDRRRQARLMSGGGLEIPGPGSAADEQTAGASPPSSSTAAGRPRSSRPRWPTAPGGAARCRCAPCSPRCCAWPWMTGRCS